jgi:hypothetical protein
MNPPKDTREEKMRLRFRMWEKNSIFVKKKE